jgi:hypothetical protein
LLEGNPRPGWLVSAGFNENVEKARLFAEHLGASKEVARQILERDLQKRKICLRFVPHSEAVSCFQIDLCDLASPLLARFGTGRLFSLPQGETGPERKVFQ